MARYGMVIDLDRCMGCRSCVEACKIENNTTAGSFWMYVFKFEEGKYPNSTLRFMPRPCQHCDNPPCAKVCPVEARYKQEDGIVLTDYKRCIGCRYCQVACPYGVNYFNWKDPEKQQYYDWSGGEGKDTYGSGDPLTEAGGAIPPYKNPDRDLNWGEDEKPVAGVAPYGGVMNKCTFCIHLVEQGDKPACVDACPAHVLHFGDLDDPNSDVSKLLARKRHFRLLEELNTKPKVYYVGHSHPSRDTRNVGPKLPTVESGTPMGV
jgi:molybdopterin-containing oxidoreductase family iron-sulfur binding subunit